MLPKTECGNILLTLIYFSQQNIDLFFFNVSKMLKCNKNCNCEVTPCPARLPVSIFIFFNPFSAGTVFIYQTCKLKDSPALEELKYF